MSRSAALADASWSRLSDSAGFRTDHWKSGTVSVWQADRELSGTGTVGGFQRRSATAGHISKQGNALLRFLLVEAAQGTVRSIPEWRSKYFHLAMRRGRKIAKVAMARRLAVQMYWMMRKEWDYEQLRKFGSHAEQPGNRHGVK